MADTLGILVVRIAADIKELEAGLKNGQGLIRESETATKSLTTATDTLTRVYRDLAVAAVAWKAYEYVKDAAMLAARYETLGVSMKVVGQNAGYNAAQMEASAQGMQKMGISMIESRQQAMRLVQAHIDLRDSEKLARIAQDAAVIGNMNSSEAFAAMIHGIQSGQTDVLRTIGLNVSMEQSYKTMADTLGKNVNALSQNERTQAILNAVMQQGAGIAGTYEAAMDTAGKQMNSMVRYTEDLKVLQGSVFNEVLTVAVMGYTEHLKESNKEMRDMAANGELKAWGMELAQVFVTVANALDNIMTQAKMAGTWLASRNLVSDITASYQTKIDAAPQGFGADAMARSNLIDQRDAEIKRAMAVLDESQVELAGRIDRMDRAWDKRMAANADKATAEAAAIVQQTSSYNTSMIALQRNREAGLISEKMFVDTIKKLWQANYGDNHAYANPPAPVASVSKAASEYEKLSEAIARELATVDEQLKYGDKLAASQKFELQTLDKLDNAYANGKITMAEWSKGYDGMDVVTEKMKQLEDLAKAIKVMESEYTEYIKTQAELEQAEKSAFDARAQGRQAVADYTKSIQDQNDLTMLEVSLMGQTQQARDIAVGQYRIELDLKKQIEAIDKNAGFDEAQREEQRAVARVAAASASANVVANAGIKAMDEIEKAGKQSAEQIGQSLTDEIMRGGKSGAQYLVDLFRTIVLRPIISAVMNPIAMGVAGMVGTMGNAAAGQAGSGMLGSLATSAGFAAFSTGMSELGTAALATSQSLIGLTGTAAQASYAATQGIAIGTGTGGTMSTIGTYMPYIAVAVAAYMLLKGGGESQTGQGITGKFSGSGFAGNNYAEMTNKPGLLRSWLGAEDNVYKNLSPLDAATQYQLTTAFGAMKTQTIAYADALGLSSDKVQGYSKDITLAFTDDAAKNKKLVDDMFAGIAADLANGVFGTTGTTTRSVTSRVIDQPGGFSGGGAEGGDYIVETWKDITTTVTEGTSVVSQYAHGLETADQVLARLATSLVSVNAMFKDLGYTLLSKGLTGADTASNIADAFGGLPAAQTTLAGYYNAFYSTAEQTANLTSHTSDSFAALGIVMPEVNAGLRDWYRGEMDYLGAQDMSIKANRDAFAGVAMLYGAVDKLSPALVTAADSVAVYAAAIKSAGDKMKGDATSLHADLMRAQGDKRGGDLYAMGITDPNKDAATQTVVSQYDANEVTRGQIATIQATKDFNRAMLVASGNASGLAAYDKAVADAALITAGWTQTQIDAVHNAQATTDAAKVTTDYNRAMLEASGNTSGLAAFDKAIADAALITAGWTQVMIDNRDAAAFAANLASTQTDAYSALFTANQAIYDQQQADANAAAQAQQQAVQAALQAANAIRDALAGAGQGIADFIKSLRASIASPANLAAQYKTDLLLAQNSDLEASKRIPASGRAYLDSQIANATSMVDVQRATARMANELDQLPAVKTYQDKLLEAVNGVAAAVGGTTAAVVDLHGRFMAELTLSARSEIVKLFEFIADDSQMTPDTKALALLASGSVSRIITLAGTSLLKPQDQELALMTGGDIVKTIRVATGNNDPLALSIAFAQSGTVEKVITASGGLLNPDQAALINGIDNYNKTINLHVAVDPASLSATQTLINTVFGTIDIGAIGTGTGLGGADLTAVLGAYGLERLTNIRAFLNTLDWGVGANASAHTAYAAAQQYGVTELDIANAMGYHLADIQAVFDSAGIPRFAKGINYLPSDMLIQAHQGERIFPAADNRQLMDRLSSPQGNNEALVAEIRASREEAKALREEVRELRASVERGNANTQVAADRLSGRQGVPFLVQVAP